MHSSDDNAQTPISDVESPTVEMNTTSKTETIHKIDDVEDDIYKASLKPMVLDYFDHYLSKLWIVNIVLYGIFSFGYFMGYVVATFYSNSYTEWNSIAYLPNLGASLPRAIAIATHITCGFITMFISVFQLSSSFRHKYINIHKIMGRIYVFCVLFTCLGGIFFVIINNFETIGGANTTIASLCYGIYWLFVTSIAVYYIRFNNNNNNNKDGICISKEYNINQHKKWMLRSFMLSIGSMMYRIWYGMAALLGYMIPRAQYLDEHTCYHDGTCQDYLRPFDQFNGWWFFVGNSLFIEYVFWSKEAKFFARYPNLRGYTLDFLAIVVFVVCFMANYLIFVVWDAANIM